MIKIKRVYEKPNESDEYRILVDRLWPRGLTNDKVKADLWLKDVAPSKSLRNWFGHSPKRWQGFRRKYFKELEGKKELLEFIMKKSRTENVTLLYGANNEKQNNAVVLKEYLESYSKKSTNVS